MATAAIEARQSKYANHRSTERSLFIANGCMQFYLFPADEFRP